MARRGNLLCLMLLLSFSVFINFGFFFISTQSTKSTLPTDANVLSTDDLWRYGKTVQDVAVQNVNNLVQYGGALKDATSSKVRELLKGSGISDNPTVNKIYDNIVESSKLVHHSAVDKMNDLYHQLRPNASLLANDMDNSRSMFREISGIDRNVLAERKLVADDNSGNGNIFTEFNISDILIHNKLAHPKGIPSPNLVHSRSGLPLNLTKYLNESRVVYNRIDTCGSKMILSVIGILSFQHNYHNYRSQAWSMYSLSENQQEIVAKYLNKQPQPYVFDRHFHWFDFDKFGLEPPTFINIICEPLPRFVSRYYFKRFGDTIKPGPRMGFQGNESEVYQTIDECILSNKPECSAESAFQMIPYFCGQDPNCLVPSRWALERAKQHVVENYAFVGIMEDFDNSLNIFERLFPQFFQDAAEVYRSKVVDRLREIEGEARQDILSPEATKEMSRRLTLEYEFYNFIRTRMELIKKQLNIE